MFCLFCSKSIPALGAVFGTRMKEGVAVVQVMPPVWASNLDILTIRGLECVISTLWPFQLWTLEETYFHTSWGLATYSVLILSSAKQSSQYGQMDLTEPWTDENNNVHWCLWTLRKWQSYHFSCSFFSAIKGCKMFWSN